MKFFYIDESGTGFKDVNSPYFLLAAFSIDVGNWKDLDGQFIQMKRNVFPYMKPEDFEIKGRDIWRGDKVFKNFPWDKRIALLRDIATMLDAIPCKIFAVSFDKLAMKGQIFSEEEAYRITFSHLLDDINCYLRTISDQGMLIIDARSDLHSSVQDRRLIDVYRDWSRDHESCFVELPWFGFSSFYSGLQLADFCGYLLDFEQNEVVFEGHIRKEFKAIYEKGEASQLVGLLKKEDLTGVRHALEKIGCNTLRSVLTKKSAATLVDIIEGEKVADACKMLVNVDRHKQVVRLIDIFRGKVVFSSIP